MRAGRAAPGPSPHTHPRKAPPLPFLALALVLLGLLPAGEGAHAQAPPPPATLAEVDSLVRLGRAETARRALLAWWGTEAEAADRRDLQRALWLRGVLTVDPSQAALDFRRLSVEFPGGPWTDDALERVALLEAAQGRPERAAAQWIRLLRDHPETPSAERARAWLEAHPPADVGSPAETDTGAAAGEARPAAPAPREALPAAAASAAAAEPSGDFAVQIGAFSTEERARAAADRVRQLGVDARVVRLPRTELFHVRSGRFADPAAATRHFDRIRAAGVEGAVVPDAARERPAGPPL